MADGGNIEVVIMSGLAIIMVVVIIVFCLVFALRDSSGIKHIKYSSNNKQEQVKKQTEQNNRGVQETPPPTQRITVEDNPKENVSKESHANRKFSWF